MNNKYTLPQLFKQKYERYGKDKIALRKKNRGIWQSYSWSDYYHNVKYIALYLISSGLKPGDKVAILGENTPEVYYAEIATLAARGTAVGVFSDCTADEVKYFVNQADISFIFAHDQEQVDKILEIKSEIPQVIKTIYWDPKGLWSYEDPILISMEKALKTGKNYDKKNPQLFDKIVKDGQQEDIALLVFTSGTTGAPKAAMLDQKCLVNGSLSFTEVEQFKQEDSYLSFVPIAWIVEQLIGVVASILSGFVVNFPESAETVTENIREMGPGILFFSPRQWESINRMVQSKIIDTTWLKRKVYSLCLPIGHKMADLQLSQKKPGIKLKILNFLAQWLAFRRLKDNLGLSGVKVGYTAGSAISPDIIKFFQGIGVNIKQVYGSSEMGLVTAHRNQEIRPETSGLPLPGSKIKLSEDGEILIKSSGMFVGYYKNETAYKKKFLDNWFCSGDYGYIDEKGHLIVIDRMDDLRSLKGGKKFSPQYPEIRLRFSPYIKEVLVVGEKEREFAAGLINIDLDNVGRWAEARSIPYTTFADLSQKDKVIELIRTEIENVNKTLPQEARIKKFLNLPKEFDADEAELTRTRKLRRAFLEDRYRDNLIEALYNDKNEYELETAITYRDGRQSVVKKNIKISSL